MTKNLTTESNLDSHVKPIKSGDELSSLELSTFGNKTKANGDLEVHGNITTLDHNSRVRTFKLESISDLKIITGKSDDGAIQSNNEITFDTSGDGSTIRFNISGDSSPRYFIQNYSNTHGYVQMLNFSNIDDAGEGALEFYADNSVNSDRAHIALQADARVLIDAGQITEGNGITFKLSNTQVGDITGHSSATQFRLYENIGASTNDYFNIAVAASGATTISTTDAAGTSGDLTLAPDGHLKITVGSGSHIEIDGNSIGFDLDATTYDATDTIVRFDQGNKKTLTFGAGNITDLYTRFPAVSGNFTLILKQDGSGSRTVTNWKVIDSGGADASGSPIVKFAGGSNPTLTTAANHVDILSFYWDADNEIAYGVATLDFQD